MKLKLTLLTLCLFGTGIFSQAQNEKTAPPKVKFKAPKNAPRDQDGNLLPPPPPPKIEVKHFKTPKGGARDKNGNFIDPPPPPPEPKLLKPEEQTDKYGNPIPPPPPPPKIERRFKAPKGQARDKDGNLLPPPPPPRIESDGKMKDSKTEKPHSNPPKIVKDKPVNANTPPVNDERS